MVTLRAVAKSRCLMSATVTLCISVVAFLGKNIFDESWIEGAQSSPIQGSEGADDHETHDYH